jgi:fructose PTS system EIIBC or EIIC component
MPVGHGLEEPAVLITMGPLLVLSVILIVGMLGGWVARFVHIPGVTGNMLAGILIGPACFDLFSGAPIASSLQPLSTFAMGVITVSVGSHLSYQRIHNALPRIISIAFCEVACCVVLVSFSARWLLGASGPTALMLGTIAAATAPATTVALIREMRAKGPFVKTLVAVVALDNILCIMLFAFSRTIVGDLMEEGQNVTVLFSAIGHTVWQFAGSFVVGMLIGRIAEWLVHYPKAHNFSVIFVSILVNIGLAEYFDLSPLMACLFFGVYLGNASEEASREAQALDPIELLLFSLFFTIAGVSLHLDSLSEAGGLFVCYVIARMVGKSVGAMIGGGLVARASRRIWLNAGFGLMPQAGVAIGLVVLLRGDAAIPLHMREVITTTVLAAVAVNEIIGPFFTRMALRRSNEANKDRRRLIEFLQEEFILVNFEAENKWDALKKLTDFYMRTHRVKANHRAELYPSIEAREKDFTTGIGSGAAIPHGRIEEGSGVRGVLALSSKGIEWDAPDGKPAQIIMLVVTPKGYEKEHLEVMASLAQMISDPAIRTRLVAAINANDAWEVIESEDTRNYNFFLEGDEEVAE